MYDDAADVDFFIGGILEKPVPGAIVGPTFQCIIGEQFVRKKFGDRFWYEVGGAFNSFTKGKYTMLLHKNPHKLTKIILFLLQINYKKFVKVLCPD